MSTAGIPRLTGPPVPVSFGSVLRGEWQRVRTVRMSARCALLTVIVIVGIAVAMFLEKGIVRQFGLVGTAMIGAWVGQIPLLVWGARVGGDEFGSGMIAATYVAVPQRGRLIAARLAVVMVPAFVFMLVLTAACAVLGLAMTDYVQLNSPVAWGHQVSMGVQQALSTAVLVGFAAALGMLLRSGSGAIVAALVLCQIVPLLALVLHGAQGIDLLAVAGYFPSVRFGQWALTMSGPTGWLGVLLDVAWFAAAGLALARTAFRDVH